MSYKYFNPSEFDCKETGENKMNERFIKRLDDLREACGFPLIVTSGYRSRLHSVEVARKAKGKDYGYHSKGIAADFKITDSRKRFVILSKAFELGFTGVAYADGFVHIDDRCNYEDVKPMTWCY